MRTTTRYGLAALLVATLALFTPRTAFADKLTPPTDSPSPQASGFASTGWSGPYGEGWWQYWEAKTKFNVKGLLPNTQYLLIAGNGYGSWNYLITTNNQGRAAATFYWEAYVPDPASYWVYDWDGVLVLVGGSQ